MYKCRFCNFRTPKVTVTQNYRCKSYDDGFYMLQVHCKHEHGNEPAVKDLLFSSTITSWSHMDEDGVSLRYNRSKELYIEQEEEEYS